MSHIKGMLQVFVYVIAGNTVGVTIFITLFSRDSKFSYVFFLQIIAIAAACASGNFIFWSRKELSKKQMKIRSVVHYLYDSLAVIGGALICKWIEPGQTGYIIFLFGLYTTVYIFITTTMFKNDKKIAEDLNKKLRKYNVDEE
ncbi:MAG: DUF3021 family protein [Anaerocolumna sp.]